MSAKILIVEDEAIIALEIKMHLTDFDYQVVGMAESAQEACAMARASQPDLVLMDIAIKGDADGIDAAQQLRAQRAVPVIFLTAHGDPATLQRAVATGSYGYLLKPFRPEELRAAIEVALAKHAIEKRQLARWLDLAAELQTSRERQRSKVAEHLHEQIAQELVAARYALSALSKSEPATVGVISQLLAQATGNVAQLANELRPALITSGLVAALRTFAKDLFDGSGVRCDVVADDKLLVLEPLATPLFHIAEAALINVKLHANARGVRLQLLEQDADIVLRISDDGQAPVTADSDKPAAFGFARMQRWVDSIGAGMQIESRPGEGSVIEVRLPRR